jgi:predicted dehydrogenase
MTPIKLALIGCGPHAKRIYLPALVALRRTYDIDLALVVELTTEREAVQAATVATGFQPAMVLVEPFADRLPADVARQLSNHVHELGVRAVIIATEPLVHKAYAEWALECGLHILIDKPVTARADATSSLTSADGILTDYDDLLRTYQRLQKRSETVFMVNAQRRVHPGFQLVERLLAEVGQLTNCPVTSLQSYHCDGQWRLPSEIVTQTYHPYCQGYGKASHSGYHIFDMMYRLYMAPGVAKHPDSMEIVSSFVQPNGFIKQLTEADYHALFGDNYTRAKCWTDRELQERYTDFGELDVTGIVTLKHQNDTIALICYIMALANVLGSCPALICTRGMDGLNTSTTISSRAHSKTFKFTRTSRVTGMTIPAPHKTNSAVITISISTCFEIPWLLAASRHCRCTRRVTSCPRWRRSEGGY